jgi:hypothetical protein
MFSGFTLIKLLEKNPLGGEIRAFPSSWLNISLPPDFIKFAVSLKDKPPHASTFVSKWKH